MAVRKTTEQESAQHVTWQETYSVRMSDHKQVRLSVLRKVWAHEATSIHVTGRRQFLHPERLLGIEGYARKHKSRGIEAGNEAGAVTLDFLKEKVYASCTTIKPEKLDIVNKTEAVLIWALAVLKLLTVEIADEVDSRLPTEPLIHTNCGVVGLKVSNVDHQAHVESETELLKFVEKVNAQQMVQQVNRMLKKVRESINTKFVREWFDKIFVLWQVVVLCGPDGKRHTVVIDNLLQSLDNSMEIFELMSQKEIPKRRSVLSRIHPRRRKRSCLLRRKRIRQRRSPTPKRSCLKGPR